MLKRSIIIILMISILFSHFFAKAPVFASEDLEGKFAANLIAGQQSNPDNINTILNDGTVTSNSGGEKQVDNIKIQPGIFNAATVVVGDFFIIPPMIAIYILSAAATGEAVFSAEDSISLGNIFSQKYAITNVNMFSDDEEYSNTDLKLNLRENVRAWYLSVRNIAITLMVIVLVYIGVRSLANLTSGDIKKIAKSKEIILNWTVAMVLLFVMHFFIVMVLEIGDELIKFMKNSASEDLLNAEREVFQNVLIKMFDGGTGDRLVLVLTFWGMAFYNVTYFFIYVKRMIVINFYIVISPIICVTYPIDKVKDSRAQGFTNWTKKFIADVIMAPIHYLVYIIIFSSMDAIIIKFPILILPAYYMIGEAYKITKMAFQLSDKASVEKDLDNSLPTLKLH